MNLLLVKSDAVFMRSRNVSHVCRFGLNEHACVGRKSLPVDDNSTSSGRRSPLVGRPHDAEHADSAWGRACSEEVRMLPCCACMIFSLSSPMYPRSNTHAYK